MADFTITGDTSLDASGANKGFDKINKGFSSIAGVGISAAKGLLTTMAGVSTAIAGVGIAAVKYNANLEQYTTSFEVMTGSAQTAAKVVADLKTMGASTPFEFEDLAKGTQTLMSFGRTVEQSGGDLKMLGDISQGNAGKLETLTRAFGKMTSSGKVSLEDINMMIDSGFNPLQEITESTGESMASLYDRISKGTISVDEITSAMQKSTAAGGKYFQSMEKQSQTINGQLSTLKDNAQSLIGEMFAGITESVGMSVLPMANGWVSDLSEAFKSGGMEGVVDAFGGILAQALGKLGEASPMLFETASALVQSFVNGIVTNLDGTGDLFGGIFTSFASSFGDIGESLFVGGLALLNNLLMGIASGTPGLLTGWMGNLNSMIGALVEFAPTIIQSGFMIIGQLAMGLLQAIPGLMDTMINGLSGLTESVNTSGDSMVESGVALIGNLLMGIANKLPDLLAQGLLLIMALVGAIGENLPEILRMAEQLIITLVDGIIRNLPKLLSAAAKMIGKLVEGLLASIPELIVAAGKLILKINSAFNDVDWGSIGMNIITGIINGLSKMAGNLADAAVKAAKEAFEAAKDFLKIKSPSRLYRDEIGAMQMAGWEVGVEKGTPSVVKANVDAAKQMVAGAQDVVLSSQLELGQSYVQGLFGSGVGSTSTTNQTNLVQNFYSQVVSAYDAYKRRIDYVL